MHGGGGVEADDDTERVDDWRCSTWRETRSWSKVVMRGRTQRWNVDCSREVR